MEEKKCKGESIRFEQRRAMVQFISEHPSLNTNSLMGPHGDQTKSQLWSDLAELLNAMAGPKKTPEKWQESFIDWKCAVKGKAQGLRLWDKRGTGGGKEPKRLNDLEEICCQQFLSSLAVDGVPGVEDSAEDCNVQSPVPLPCTPVHTVSIDMDEGDDEIEIAITQAPAQRAEVEVSGGRFTKRMKPDPAQERKRIRKRLEKEEELDLQLQAEKGQIAEHLTQSTMQTECLRQIQQTLDNIEKKQDSFLALAGRGVLALEAIAQAFSGTNTISIPLV